MMQSTIIRKAPYAPATSVISVIKRYRERGLPEPVDNKILKSVGITHGVAPFTLVALRFLGLLDVSGCHTEKFDVLRRASSETYPLELLQIIQSAYTEIFVIVDPAQDTRERIEDAFRQYDPQAQRDRMVALFLGLCREAGLVISGEVIKKSERQIQSERSTKPKVNKFPSQDLQSVPSTVLTRANTPLLTEHMSANTETRVSFDLVTALVRQLPQKGSWTSAQRGRWITALQANIDLVIEVTDADEL